jgi:hypothetical protein
VKAGAALKRGAALARGGTLGRRARLAPVSAKRKAENRERRAMVAELWPERPPCEWPGCTRPADDVHEALTRGRGGSITDRENARALCREHHDLVTFTPESELGLAYELGLLRHSWDALGGEAA